MLIAVADIPPKRNGKESGEVASVQLKRSPREKVSRFVVWAVVDICCFDRGFVRNAVAWTAC